MKRFLIAVILVMVMSLLAACGGNSDDSGESDTSNDDTNTTTETASNDSGEAGFTATITGAVETELTGSGYFQCEEAGFGELAIGASGSFTNNILILVPIDATAGSTYDIVSERLSAEQASASYVGEDLQTAYYEKDVSGSITLDAVASQSGEPVTGNFEFAASLDEENTVTITGSFDFTAGENAYYNCNNSQ